MRTEECCLPNGIETPKNIRCSSWTATSGTEEEKGGGQFTYESKQLWSKVTWRCVNHISQSLTEIRGNLPGRATYSRPKIINSTKKWTWLKNKCTIVVLRVLWCSLQVISKSLCLRHEFLTLEVTSKDTLGCPSKGCWRCTWQQKVHGWSRTLNCFPTQVGFTSVLWTLQFWQRKIYTELKYHYSCPLIKEHFP